MKTAWRHLIQFGLRRLYNELAWAYEPVSWLVSAGEWHRWQQAVEPWVQEGIGLEIGCGRGDLLAWLLARGFRFYGLDLSPAMLHKARRATGRQSAMPVLCRGRAEQLPFAAGSFGTVITTFPAEFMGDPATWREIYRVLQPGGVWLWVDGGRLLRPWLWKTVANFAFRFTTGNPSPSHPLPKLLAQTGFAVSLRDVAVSHRSRVTVVLAEKPAV
jgi:ubiquinone/menaquinone biosynthesis C-methylase UbiE